MARGSSRAGSWRDELNDFVRAFGGAFIFAIPLLYTMETWWIGTYAVWWKLLAFLAVAFAVSLGLSRSRIGGFKQVSGIFGAVEQAFDGLAVGLVAAAATLLVLNRIGPDDPPETVVGTIALLAAPLSIGASIANAVFGQGGSGGGKSGGKGGKSEGQGGKEGGGSGKSGGKTSGVKGFLGDLGGTVVGGIFIGFTVAPTQEIPLLAAELDYAHEIALIVFSLLLSYAIVFAGGYGSGEADQPGPFQRPITETFVSYVASLVVALGSLVLFHQVDANDPLNHVVAMVLVLGLPTTVGGAAGRLAV